VGLKDASGQVDFAAHVAALCGDRLPLYAGNDDLTLPLLSLGGRGVISVASNLYPEKVSRMCRAYREGDVATAARMQTDLLPLCDALFADVNPIPVKAALSMLGVCQDALRLPLVPADERVREKLERVLTAAGT
jgi:4-hydroxy-tetrahydrodipicolinate synthase